MTTDRVAKAQFKTHISPELVERWKALAKARGLSVSAFQELVMRRVLDGEDADVGQLPRSADGKKRATTLRLFQSEIDAVRDAAKHDGYTVAGWIAALVRAKLRQAPILTAAETDALLKCSVQLMAVGRNINAAVRRLHADGLWSDRNQPLLTTLAVVRQAESHIHALQAAAERRGSL